MKTKLFAILAISFCAGLFSSCTEEEIKPDTNSTERGSVSEDPHQWD